MNSLTIFQNLHQNSSIIVCGCGESLNDLTEPEKFITIGVNDIGRKFHPDYLVVVNPKNQFSGDRFSYVETSQAGYLFTQLDLPVRHPHIVKFKLGQFGGTDFSDKNVLHYTNNSPYIALHLAILMGAKRIGLIGVDFTDHHFFAKTGRHPLAPQFEAIDQQYQKLAEAARNAGVEIYNLSPISRLEAFPKISVAEFEAFSEPAPKSKETPLKIVSYATTPVAGVPAILARCINARTAHSARCVWATNSYGNGVEFTGDVEWKRKPAEAETLLAEADLVIAHNGKIAPEHEKLFREKAVITMAHNYLWNVDERFVKSGFPGAVVGQYQAVLPEFDGWSVVPNPVPLWEAEYSPGQKNVEITVCYTPSGKHEKYPPGHKLYWHSKGFETTRRVLENLSRSFPIKLEVIGDRQISHTESLLMKQRSHIVIDECVTGSYHRNSLEGLAAGCVVINGLGILPGVVDVLRLCAGGRADIPFVSATLENLEEVLTGLIESGKDSLVKNGAENRIWLEKHWDFNRHWQSFWMPLIEKSLRRVNRKATFGKIDDLSKEVYPKMKKYKEGVSVVIPHGGKKRLPHLRTCLANLRQCQGVGEIIVVEMDDIPQAAEIARRWADKYVFIKRTDLFERARTLNIGSAFAECEFVLWLDNDLLVPGDFVSRGVAELTGQNLDFLLPFSEIKYLSFADTEQIMEGVLNPEKCSPIKIYTNTMTEGGTGMVRRDFLTRFGGIPAGFRGWGGEDNGWMHKVRLLGKAGRTISRQTVFHLYHALSGGNGGNAHILANPHYQANADYLLKIKKITDGASFLKEFPPPPIRLWDDQEKIYFIADKQTDDLSLIGELKKNLLDLFGIGIKIISAKKLASQPTKIKTGGAFVLFDKKTVQKIVSADVFACLLEKTIIVAPPRFSLRQTKKSVFAVLKADPESLPANIESETGVWNFTNGEQGNLALTLAQTLSLLMNRREPRLEKKISAAVKKGSADLPVWFYWEGERPGWIEICHRTILANAPGARFLTPETFAELWTTDQDIDISRLGLAHRADFIRAFLLAKFGGLWIDADCIVMGDLQFLLEKLKGYDFIAHRERSGFFSNGFIGAGRNSPIAREFYERICRCLREKHHIGWVEIGSKPLTETLESTAAPFWELECEQIQPICWTQPEKFFARRKDREHEQVFDEDSVCYMLSNTSIGKYQTENPSADLCAEDTFFSFAVRRALGKVRKTGKALKAANGSQIQTNGNIKPAKNGTRWHALSFYLEMIARITPRKVLDADVGLGCWAILLRDFFEPSIDKKQWRITVEALFEKKPADPEIFRSFYDRIQFGRLDTWLKSLKEKQNLIILGDHLIRNKKLQNEKLLKQTLDMSDYILLNLKGFSNGNLLEYLSLHPEQVVDFRSAENSVSVLLSQSDPKQMRPPNNLAEIFCRTAESNARQNIESVSGPGSSLELTVEIRRRLPLLFAFLRIKSMLDAPCGDLNWLRHVDLKLDKYIGLDIIPDLIRQNQNLYENPRRKFMVADITKDLLPKAELIFCRDCLVHLSFEQIFSALRNFYRSGAKYLLTTTFPARESNTDIQTGDWRPLNLQLPPFNFPAPFKLLNEQCTEGGGEFADKSLGLWRMADIAGAINV